MISQARHHSHRKTDCEHLRLNVSTLGNLTDAGRQDRDELLQHADAVREELLQLLDVTEQH